MLAEDVAPKHQPHCHWNKKIIFINLLIGLQTLQVKNLMKSAKNLLSFRQLLYIEGLDGLPIYTLPQKKRRFKEAGDSPPPYFTSLDLLI